MKAEITKTGNLRFDRPGYMGKPQNCPFQEEVNCGDWCVLFGEPIYEKTISVELKLCKKTYYFNPEDFEDLRK